MEKLIESIKHHEGVRLVPYRDTEGKLTIGIGRNLDANGISLKEAEILLRNDISKAVDDFWRLPFAVILHCNIDRRRALTEMIFNLGLPTFLTFKKMLHALECSEYEDAAREMLDSKWAVQVGERARRLANVIRTGVWWV